MKVRSLILTFAAASLLAASHGLIAAQAPKAANTVAKPVAAKKPAPTSVMHGTITSLEDSQIVVSEKAKSGKSETRTFMLDRDTAKSGALAVGNEVTIHYRSDNSHLMATSLVGKASKSAAKTPAHKG